MLNHGKQPLAWHFFSPLLTQGSATTCSSITFYVSCSEKQVRAFSVFAL